MGPTEHDATGHEAGDADRLERRHSTEPERAIKAIVGGVLLGLLMRLFATGRA